MADYDIGEAFRRIEEEMIASMMRNLDRHRAEEEEKGYNWSMWQTEQLKALEQYRQNNLSKYSDEFKSINSKISGLITMARAEGNMDQEAAILSAIKKGFKANRKSKDAMTGAFFRLNTKKLEALIKATTDDFEKAETAMLRRANDQYRKIIFNAQVYANIGAATYEKAVDMATKDFLAAGINCIEYKNGSRHTISDYADMCIKTATKRAYLTGEGEKRKEWGISTVIMNKRGNPCPKCLPFVGKILIDDVWSGGKPEDGPYMLMSMAVEKGLYHVMCRDSHTTYFPFMHEKDDISDEEKETSIKKYNEQQKQNYYKNQAKKCERVSKYSLDPDNKRMYKARAEKWKESLKNTGNIKLEQTTKITKKNHSSDYGIVNRKFVNSKEYHDKFEGLTKYKPVNEIIYQETMAILEHRDGTAFEDLVVIDSRKGNIVARFTESITPGKITLTEEQVDTILKYDGNVILLHNHPNSSRASYTDIRNLKIKNIDGTIAAGHDGSIYFVSDLDEKFDIDEFWDEVYNSYKKTYKDNVLASYHATDDLYDLGVFTLEGR